MKKISSVIIMFAFLFIACIYSFGDRISTEYEVSNSSTGLYYITIIVIIAIIISIIAVTFIRKRNK